MKIENGPFAGTEIPENEVISFFGNDGETIPFWPTHCRTPIFLQRFSAEEGWQVVVNNERGNFDLPDTRNNVVNSNPGPIFVQPTHLFVAMLMKDGKVFAQASTLAIIDGPSAWERGETTARGRLYEAAGLLGFLKHSMASEPAAPVSAPKQSIPSVATIPLPVEAVAPAEASSMTSSRRDDDEEAAAASEASESPLGQITASQDDGKVVDVRSRAPKGNRTRISRDVNENLRDQILMLAQSRHVEIPEITTNDEAKAVYKKLLKGESLTEIAS